MLYAAAMRAVTGDKTASAGWIGLGHSIGEAVIDDVSLTGKGLIAQFAP